MSRRASTKPRGAAKAIEDAIDPIERLDVLVFAAHESFLSREIDDDALNRVAVALDMLSAEVLALRRALYGDALGP